jgi:hypothetical protein
MKHYIIFTFLLASSLSLFAQKTDKPKLVVGIVVDQMRDEYLHRLVISFRKGALNE